MSDSSNLKDLFEKAQSELIAAQSELSALAAAAAADPWLESQQRESREKLTSTRDERLQTWARMGLSWLLRGGSIQLTTPDGETTELSAPTPQPAPQPATFERRAPTRSATVVQTVRRGSPRPEVIEYTPPRSSTWSRPAPVMNDLDAETLREALDLLTEPLALHSAEDIRNELNNLLQGSTSQLLMDWATFPKPIQRSLVGHVVARARHVQDELPENLFPPDLSHDLAFSKREQPGFVFGLMRHHHPVGESWLSDAQKWWQDLINQLPEDLRPDPEGALEELGSLIAEDADEQELVEQALTVLEDGLDPEDPRLVELMAPYRHLLKEHARFKKLRKAIRALEDAEE